MKKLCLMAWLLFSASAFAQTSSLEIGMSGNSYVTR